MEITSIRVTKETRDLFREWAGEGISLDHALKELLDMAIDRGWTIKHKIVMEKTKIEMPKEIQA